MEKIGVIIANTGSPDEPTPEATSRYLAEFLSDPRICPMNPKIWGFILNHFILPKRSVASAAKYKRIWTENGSPLSAIMASLALNLEASLNEDAQASRNWIVKHAMSYGNPSIASVISELSEAKCDKIVVIPLYPQSAFSTTRVIADKVEDVLAKSNGATIAENVVFVENYWSNERYLDAIAQTIIDAGYKADDNLLIAFHSIPMKDISDGDTYDTQALQSAANIAAKAGATQERWQVGFQCRFDRSRRWLGPNTKDCLSRIPDSGRLFVVAPNFSIDCLETIYDINGVLQQAFLDADEQRDERDFVYVPCLNDSDLHVKVLRDVVRRSLIG